MLSEAIQLCQQMVKIPSINPQTQTNCQPPYGEQEMVSFVEQWLTAHDLSPDFQTVVPQRDNVYAIAQGEDTTKTLLLCAHTDVVDIEGMTIDPFSGLIEDDKLHGRGACDTKASLATMMIAFRDRVLKGRLPYNLTILASCGEEFNMMGARHFARTHKSSISGAIFGEPTSLNVIRCHKGVLRLTLQCHGQSCHSSTPNRGKNAIFIMAKCITAIEGFAKILSKEPPHSLLGHETISVNVINGGSQFNIIPDKCKASIDWRILPGREIECCIAQLHNHLSKVTDRFALKPECQFRAMETSGHHDMVLKLHGCAKNISSVSEVTSAPFATDASGFATLNIPTVVFGPGDITQAHTATEYVEINQIDQALAILTSYLDGEWGL